VALKRSFAGKCVVVTGAAGGLGLAYARRFGQAGARVAMLDLKTAQVEEAAHRLTAEGMDVLPVTCDLADSTGVAASMARVMDCFGGVDVLINNAGISARAAFAQTQPAVFHRVMAVNFFGSVYTTQAALESLIRRKGMIISISSLAGFSPLLGRTAYCASKHAHHGLFDSLRSELRDIGVGVLIVCPGFTATGIGAAALDGDGSITRHPQSMVGRPAAPEDVADQVFRAAQKNKRLLVLTSVGRIGRVINKISPRLYECLMVRSVKAELER